MAYNKIEVDFVALELGMNQLQKQISNRVKQLINQSVSSESLNPIPPETINYFLKVLSLEEEDARVFSQDPAYYFAVLVTLIPHLNPTFFDDIITNIFQKSVDFPQIGGVRGTRKNFIPTLETLFFVCQADTLKRRIDIQRLFEENALLNRKNILKLERYAEDDPINTFKIVLSLSYLELLTLGEQLPPRFSSSFPAKRVSTSLTLENLVLEESTKSQILEIENWIKFGRELENDSKLGIHIKKGYRTLFFGSPGTGKTITAGVLGQRNNKPVYVIDLSMVVSKYIGETEKNLASLLDKAERQDWILFFDEADALFGKRSNVKDAHDRFANQEIAYLLQRIEDYDGLVIMATNIKKNIDDAFLRRFQSVIYFPLPNAKERKQLWESILPATIPLNENVNIDEIAKKYSLSGGNIVNIVQYCSLQAKMRFNKAPNNKLELLPDDLMTGIKREFAKEGKGI